jgi:hypothetical protein
MLDYGNATRTGPSQKPPMAISFYYTIVYTQLPVVQSRSERRKKEEETMGKKEFREFLSYTKAIVCVSPSSTVLEEIYVTKRGRGSGASNQGFSFCQFFCVPPFSSRFVYFWPGEKKRCYFLSS